MLFIIEAKRGKMKTQRELEVWIQELIEKDELWRFYKSKEFRHLKEEVLKEQHYECQICKEQGHITKADTVHHIQYVRKHPELALSKTYLYMGKEHRNLIAICKSCHNKVHKEKGRIRRTIKVVTGLPGCGKTTYVRNHRLIDEPVYDLDLLVDAMLMGQGKRDYAVSIANAMLEEFVNVCRELHASAWVIRTAPNEEELSLLDAAGAVYIDLPCTIEEAVERRTEISKEEMKKINEKYERYKSMKTKEETGERW